jgi:hypothetical protein
MCRYKPKESFTYTGLLVKTTLGSCRMEISAEDNAVRMPKQGTTGGEAHVHQS